VRPPRLFDGNSEIDQIFHIFRLLGTPDEATWPGVTSLPDYQSIFPCWRAKPLREHLPQMSAAAADLLSKLIEYKPSERMRAESALEHEFFAEMRQLREPISTLASYRSPHTSDSSLRAAAPRLPPLSRPPDNGEATAADGQVGAATSSSLPGGGTAAPTAPQAPSAPSSSAIANTAVSAAAAMTSAARRSETLGATASAAVEARRAEAAAAHAAEAAAAQQASAPEAAERPAPAAVAPPAPDTGGSAPPYEEERLVQPAAASAAAGVGGPETRRESTAGRKRDRRSSSTEANAPAARPATRAGNKRQQR
jgi:hypothetical protein